MGPEKHIKLENFINFGNSFFFNFEIFIISEFTKFFNLEHVRINFYSKK